MYKDLKDKVVIITGGNSGIGKSTSERFGREESKVVINYLDHAEDAEAIVKTIKESGGDAIAVQGDVSKEEDIKNLIQKAHEKFGRIDVMINNAGFEKPIPTHEMSLEEWSKVIDINLTGAFLGSREAVKYYLEHDIKGQIINTASVHDVIPWPNYVNYAASKGGLKLMMETMSMEYGKNGIRINNVSPGAVVTEHTREKFSDPATRKETLEMIPLNEIGEADQVANINAFLASEQAHYIHGTTIYVDGGMTNYPAFMGGKG
nr:glucose 1-dehydrogenase [Mammaliicoccus sp. Marseille-Q6498]